MSPLTQTLGTVVLFILLLASVPAILRWAKARAAGNLPGGNVDARVVSAVAVGPHQRVVTVEVGPADARTWLVLGVTQQTISCLHSSAAPQGRSVVEPAPFVVQAPR